MKKKGFTLIELLIVIAILAVLASTVILVLNPAELLRQARDTQRVSDLASLNVALGLYISSVSGASLTCTTNRCTAAGSPFGIDGGPIACATISTSTAISGGTGWIPVDFTTIPGGSPLGKEPLDPINAGTTTLYGYTCSSTSLTYKLVTFFESTKYNTTDNLPGKDGGTRSTVYEVGSGLGL